MREMEDEVKVIEFFKYSSKSMCITGNGTKDIKQDLSDLGARYNRTLTDPNTKEKFQGYILTLKKKEECEKLLGMTLIDVEIEDKPKSEYKKPVEIKKEDLTDDDIEFYMYSERSFIVAGQTKSIKEDLKEIGGRWNRTLKGWIFSIKRLEEVESYLDMEVELVKPE